MLRKITVVTSNIVMASVAGLIGRGDAFQAAMTIISQTHHSKTNHKNR